MKNKEPYIFYPYRIEFIKPTKITSAVFINPEIAADINHIGTKSEALRIVNHYYPGAIIKDKVYPYDENSQQIIYKDELIGYLVGNVHYRGAQ